jgi:hypothetical protein
LAGIKRLEDIGGLISEILFLEKGIKEFCDFSIRDVI